jgi:formylmethanofuran dehydrogenase subunit E
MISSSAAKGLRSFLDGGPQIIRTGNTILRRKSADFPENSSPHLAISPTENGHLCDGLVTAWVELGAALRDLFPDGVVDRTDVRAVSKNAPCWADAGAWMTGARINQGTLVLDNSVGDGFIVQRISTGAAVRVSLRPGVYPPQLATLEQFIRSRRARGEAVASVEIERFEQGANEYSRKLLNTPPDEAVTVETLANYIFPDHSPNPVMPRSDTINRDAPRSGERVGGVTK